MTKFREGGAIGALLDEYERAIMDLVQVINEVDTERLARIIDSNTKDHDCISIKTILDHLIRAGYNYVIAIKKHLGEDIEYRTSQPLVTIAEYQHALGKMFAYNVSFFDDYPDIKLEEYDNDKKINVQWGQQYDIEQLYEHAIVHVLRHRRQIEKILAKTDYGL
jgi:hypothetical protein